MKLIVISIVAIAAAGLAGCGGSASPQASTHHGRYAGIGLYSPGPLWSKMAVASPAATAAAARTTDDEQIMVVVDSDTGEVRQCGNLSGYCVGMNPWTRGLTAAQTAPISLNEHAAPPSDAAPASSAQRTQP